MVTKRRQFLVVDIALNLIFILAVDRGVVLIELTGLIVTDRRYYSLSK